MANWFTEFITEIEALPGQIAGLFTKDQTQIHTAIGEAQSALGAAATIATITEPGANGAPSPVATALTKVSNVLTTVSTTANALANADSLNQVATDVGGAVDSFVNSGIAIKNSGTQAAVDNAVAKTQQVVTVVSAAANASSPSASPATT